MQENPLGKTDPAAKSIAMRYADQVLPATRSVLVSAVPSDAKLQDIRSFFSSRCGTIEAIRSLHAKSPAGSSWCVTFAHRPSVVQALSLGERAEIKGKKVSVSAFTSDSEEVPEDAMTVAVASVIATGFNVAEEAIQSASTYADKLDLASRYAIAKGMANTEGQKLKGEVLAFNERHQLSQRIKASGQDLQARVQELDEQYGVAEQAGLCADLLALKANSINKKYQLTQRATETQQQIAAKAKQIGAQAAVKASEAQEAAEELAEELLDTEVVQKGLAAFDLTRAYVVQKVNAVKEKAEEAMAKAAAKQASGEMDEEEFFDDDSDEEV